MYIQTFIEKFDGSPVFVDFEGVRYIFQKNEFGDSVCFVGNQNHQRRLLMMGEGTYVEYEPPEQADMNTTLGATPQTLGNVNQKPIPLPKGEDSLLSSDKPEEPEPQIDLVGKAKGPVIVEGSTGDPTAVAPADPIAPISEADKAQDAMNETAIPQTEVTWVPEAVDAKIKQFKFLGGDGLKLFVDENRESVMGWPREVREALALKINKKLPGEDPAIEGFVINDYLGAGTASDS